MNVLFARDFLNGEIKCNQVLFYAHDFQSRNKISTEFALID